MKKEKESFILNSSIELKKIQNFKKYKSIYLFNYSANDMKNKNEFLDFYLSSKNYKSFNRLNENTCKKWFKTYQNSKITDKKINLLGNILFGRLISESTDKIRILLSLSNISKNYDKIYYSSSLPNEFKTIAKYFKNLEELKFISKVPDYLQSVTKRSTFHFSPSIHKLSGIARNIQDISSFSEQTGKILIFPDPYYQKLFNKRNDTIYLNSINLKKGFYYKNKVKKNFYFKKSDLNKKEIKKSLYKILGKKNKFKNIIVDIFQKSIITNYSNGIKYFNWCYDYNKELLQKYKPIKVIMSNTISFDYLIINYLCKELNIKTIISFDGLETVYNPLNVLFEKKKYIYDKLICYGSADYMLNLRHKIQNRQLLLGQLPLINNSKKKNNLKELKKYDFVIMAYQPRTFNLESRWDKKIFHAFQVIKLLNKLNYKKIGIKLKPDTVDTKNEFMYIQNFISKNNLICDVIGGKFEDLLPKVKNIVGGISTAIWEASSIGTPYYIYEPFDMGLLDFQIKKSILFNKNNCATNLKSLEKKIKNKICFKVNKALMFNGTSLDKLNL